MVSFSAPPFKWRHFYLASNLLWEKACHIENERPFYRFDLECVNIF
jgi:hypothetical protein